MSRSVLLQLVRDSIQEVFQAQITIDRDALLKEHPLLDEKISIIINIFIAGELKGTYSSQNSEASLLSNIIISAKKAAFEDKKSAVLTTSEYLHSELELILNTPDGMISEKDPSIIQMPSVTAV